MNTRLITLKTVLWGLGGMAFVFTVARFTRGLGAITNLNDASPWGLWIAFDVMAGVALAAGGFVLAAAVYIFGLERYREFTRPAILTAFLGYTAVAVGLLYDLGLPWNIWHPIIFPQPTSVLFEVAACVMLYLTVLLLEFSPVILEHRWFARPIFQKIHRFLKRATIPLVITGIVLSSLHQSSLGSLFLIVPHRLHALWYSPIIWILFLVSAIGLGLMMVVAESIFSGFFFAHKPDPKKLAGMGRAAAWVLLTYAGLRLGDLAFRGQLAQAFSGTWQANLFLFEMLFSALVPAALLLIRAFRERIAGVGIAAAMVVFGMIGYRFDVCLVAFLRPAETGYFPSFIEVAISVGIMAGFMLVFLFFVQYLKVFNGHDPSGKPTSPITSPVTRYHPSQTRWMMPARLGIPRQVTMAAVFGAAIAAAFLPAGVLSGDMTKRTPVRSVRTLAGWTTPGEKNGDTHLALAQSLAPSATSIDPPAEGSQASTLMLIDANRDGRAVLFWHDGHAQRMGGQHACAACHHQNLPLDRNSTCISCHRDMYLPHDIFVHQNHVDKLGGNDGCIRCHTDPAQPRLRANTTACKDCHQNMLVAGSRVPIPKDGSIGFASGYMDAMHELCIGCHKQVLAENPDKTRSDFAQCATCHTNIEQSELRALAPRTSPRKG